MDTPNSEVARVTFQGVEAEYAALQAQRARKITFLKRFTLRKHDFGSPKSAKFSCRRRRQPLGSMTQGPKSEIFLSRGLETKGGSLSCKSTDYRHRSSKGWGAPGKSNNMKIPGPRLISLNSPMKRLISANPTPRFAARLRCRRAIIARRSMPAPVAIACPGKAIRQA